MNIGFDGKRAYQNTTGLGNHTRSLVSVLAEYYPAEKYFLFAPRLTALYNTADLPNVKAITPPGIVGQKLQGWWRRSGMVKDIVGANIDLFHGVSNELPRGIKKTGVRTVVTIHDIIFERFPETYNFDERYVHRWKMKHACRIADAVIAISQQTKNDLIEFYKVPAEKISICYQSCNPIFQRRIDDTEKQLIKKRYNLPDNYFLFVSSITPRKNLLTVCKALVLLKGKSNIPLVVIGNGKQEKEKARQFMSDNGMSDQLILLNELPQSNDDSFRTAADFPAIYQQAMALVYPSIFEGFGLPLLEALWSGLPVISSNASCLPEVGGDAALYFAPDDHATLAKHLFDIVHHADMRLYLTRKGFQQAQHFTTQKYAESVMQVYQQILA